MIKIRKKELLMEMDFKKKLDIVFSFCNLKPKYINGSIRKIEHTNLSYIEPHRVIVKDITILVFNYQEEVAKHIFRLRKFYDVAYYEATYYVDQGNIMFNFVNGRNIVRVFPLEDIHRKDYNKKEMPQWTLLLYFKELLVYNKHISNKVGVI